MPWKKRSSGPGNDTAEKLVHILREKQLLNSPLAIALSVPACEKYENIENAVFLRTFRGFNYTIITEADVSRFL